MRGIHRFDKGLVVSLAAAVLTFGLTQAAAGQARGDEAEGLQVLFLGDGGHHEPAERARQIVPYLSAQGIQVTYTDDLGDLNAENLSRYDALVLYANHPEITQAQEAALLDFVEKGGGLVPVHAASAMFTNSDAYVSLVGGAFRSHGMGTFTTRTVRPDHPAIAGLTGFESADETYVHMKHNPDKVVLAVRQEGAHEEPWTWVRTHGDGRVFYTAWGHTAETWANPGFQRLLERGIRWTAGDWALAAELAPPGREYMAGEMPYYPPGVGWGVTGEPFTQVQEPLRPEASMAQTTAQPGFRLELFAADPDVVNPIDMAWDERGRLWIVETVNYPNEFTPGRKGEDRVKILEDTDGDGRADRFTVFADSLNIPTSLVLTNGGVIVAQAPDFLFLKDTDGDDRADVKQVLFTGWGTFDTHAGPNNLRYGFDNRIWGALGYSGFDGAVDGDSITFTQGFYRFRPDGTGLEYMTTTNNNTWGLGFNEEGMVLGSTANGHPVVHMPVPHRFYDAVRGWERPTLDGIHDDNSYFPITEGVRQVDWHGKYTSAAGFELYTARAFPEEYWNRIGFVTEPTGHLVGKFSLEPQGSSFRAHNEWNVVASRDEWFAPIQTKVGPDDALWVIDWYDPIIQHNPTPPGFENGEGNAYVTPLRDRQHSRIYRLVHEDGTPATRPARLDDATPAELVRSLRDENLFWRQTAQRLLVERGQTDVVPHLAALAHDVRVDDLGLNVGAVHALWTMHGLGALDGGDAEALAAATSALRHPSAAVRRTAVMVLPKDARTLDAIVDAGLLPDPSAPNGTEYTVHRGAMSDADPHVRLAALLALAELPASDRAGEVVADVIVLPENANDRWLRDAATAAGARHSGGFLAAMLERPLAEGGDTTYAANVRNVIRVVAGHHAAGSPTGATVSMLSAAPSADSVVAGALLEGFAAGWAEGAAPDLSAAERARLNALWQSAPPAQRERLGALAARWGQPDFFSAGR